MNAPKWPSPEAIAAHYPCAKCDDIKQTYSDNKIERMYRLLMHVKNDIRENL